MPTTSTPAYTISLYYQNKPNSAGLCPLGLKYYYNKKQDAISLGISALPKAVLRTKLSSTAENAVAYNELVQTRMALLDEAASGFEEPTWDKVKPRYLFLVQSAEVQETMRAKLIEDFRAMSVEKQRKLYRRAQQLGIADEIPAITLEQYHADPVLHWSGVPVIGLNATDATTKSEQQLENAFFHEQLDLYLETFTHNRQVAHIVKGWIKTFREFETVSGYALTFKGMNARFYLLYERFLFETKDYYNNTFSNHVGRLKMFLSWNEKQEVVVNKYYTQFKEWMQDKDTVVYLKQDELDALWEYKLTDPYEIRVRDTFVFANLTGLRLVDLERVGELAKAINKDESVSCVGSS